MIERRWFVLLALAFMMCIGESLPIFAGSVVNTFMAVERDWSRQTLGMLVTVNMIVAGLLAPVGAILVNRIGFRRTLGLGASAVVIVGLSLAIIVHAPWQAVLAYSVGLGIVANLTGTVACQTAVAAWFSGRQRTTALSLLYAGVHIFGISAVWTVTRVMEVTGTWKAGWSVFAGAGVIGLIITLLILRDKPNETPELAPASDSEFDQGVVGHGAVGDVPTFTSVLKTPLLWAILVCMIAATSGAAFLNAHVQVYLRDAGFDPASAASVVSWFALAILIGNLSVGIAAFKLSPRVTLAIATAIFAGGLLILVNVADYSIPYLYALTAGFGFGAAQVSAMAALGNFWGKQLFPALTALALLLQTVGGAIVPLVAGAYFDVHQSYLPVIAVLITLNLVGAAILIFMRPARKRQSDSAMTASILEGD